MTITRAKAPRIATQWRGTIRPNSTFDGWADFIGHAPPRVLKDPDAWRAEIVRQNEPWGPDNIKWVPADAQRKHSISNPGGRPRKYGSVTMPDGRNLGDVLRENSLSNAEYERRLAKGMSMTEAATTPKRPWGTLLDQKLPNGRKVRAVMKANGVTEKLFYQRRAANEGPYDQVRKPGTPKQGK